MIPKTYYTTRYVHKISLSVDDTGPGVAIPALGSLGKNSIARYLREAGILPAGTRLRAWRWEPRGERGCIVAFPMGRFNPWHSVILTPDPGQPDES